MFLTDKLKRHSTVAAAALLIFASMVPLLSQQRIGAYALLSNRYIQMSSSATGAVTDGQDVTYQVSAQLATTGNVGGLVVDFCSNSPIVGDSCTAPTGFNTNFATLAIANQVGVTDFTVDTTNSTANKVVLTRTAASVASGTTVTFDLGDVGASDGITNPTNTNTTFYARILTYATTAEAQGYASATPGTPVDAGGAALSTAPQITVTAKVQERLTFCVYANDLDAEYAVNDCVSKEGTDVTLGDANGVLDPAGPYVDKKARYGITTNAANDAVIRVKGSTLTSGSFTIDPIGAGTAEAASTAGSEQFGFCTYQELGSGLTIDTRYDGDDGDATPGDEDDCSTTTQSAGTGTTGGTGANGDTHFTFIDAELSSTYGSPVATKAAGDYSTGTLAFIGNVSNTTEAGIYTTTLTFIATGTY